MISFYLDTLKIFFKKKRKRKQIIIYNEEEMERILQENYIIENIFGCLYISPVNKILDKGIKCLSYGFGTAIWSFNMSKIYKNSNFYDINVSPFYELYKKQRQNENYHLIKIKFWNKNKKHLFDYKDNTFDYIYQRLINTTIDKNYWLKILKELYRICKPNGYVEIVELDLNIYDGDFEINIFNNILFSTFLDLNINPFIIKNICRLMENIGFVNIRIQTYKCYTNDKILSKNITKFISRYEKFINKEKIPNYDNIINNILKNSKNSYIIWYVIYAMKP